MEAITLITAALSIVSLIFYHYVTRFSFWRKRGIPGPVPLPLIGNMLDTLETPSMDVYSRKQQKYGDLFGTFEGSTPQLVVFDPDLAKKVMIQDFDYVTDRFIDGFDHPLEKKMFFAWPDKEWRAGRATCSTAFSSGKLKAMTPLILQSVDKLLFHVGNKLKESEGNELETKSLFRSFALYNIGQTMFGIEMDTFDWEKTDPTIKAGLMYFEMSWFKMVLAMILPRWLKTFLEFTATNKKGLMALHKITTAIIKQRTDNNIDKRYADFISIMLRNRVKPEEEEKVEIGEGQWVPRSSARKFTDDEIMANCLLFLMAGTDTTKSMICFTAFVLAKHADEQEKLYQEVVGIAEKTGQEKIMSESLPDMPFLDAVINETLRLYPVAILADRRVSKDYNLEVAPGKVVNLPAETLIYISIWHIHRNEKYFHQADKFIPDRFFGDNAKKIDPKTFLPFGAGPRGCIGKRMALVILKLAIANLILKYKLQSRTKTMETLDVSQSNYGALLTPDIFIKFVERKPDKGTIQI